MKTHLSSSSLLDSWTALETATTPVLVTATTLNLSTSCCASLAQACAPLLTMQACLLCTPAQHVAQHV